MTTKRLTQRLEEAKVGNKIRTRRGYEVVVLKEKYTISTMAGNPSGKNLKEYFYFRVDDAWTEPENPCQNISLHYANLYSQLTLGVPLMIPIHELT